MHLTGKICAWLIVPLLIGVVVLAGQAVNVRNSWIKKADELTAQNEQKAKSVADKETQLRELIAERSLLMRSWGRPWTARNVSVSNPQSGEISVDLGTQNGLQIPGAEGPPILYGFFTPQNGPSRFIGPFQVTDLRDRNSTMQLTKLPRSEDIANWQTGAWRFWQFLPSEYTNRYESQWNMLISAEERLSQARSLEQTMVDRKARTEEQAAERVAELQGGDQLPESDNLPIEDLEGLTKALSLQESSRNQVLLDVDRLRRAIHDAQMQLKSLLEQSRQLVDQLPQPSVDTASNAVQ